MLWKAMAFGGHGACAYRRDSRRINGSISFREALLLKAQNSVDLSNLLQVYWRNMDRKEQI